MNKIIIMAEGDKSEKADKNKEPPFILGESSQESDEESSQESDDEVFYLCDYCGMYALDEQSKINCDDCGMKQCMRLYETNTVEEAYEQQEKMNYRLTLVVSNLNYKKTYGVDENGVKKITKVFKDTDDVYDFIKEHECYEDFFDYERDNSHEIIFKGFDRCSKFLCFYESVKQDVNIEVTVSPTSDEADESDDEEEEDTGRSTCEKCSAKVPDYYWNNEQKKNEEWWVCCDHDGWYCPKHSPTNGCVSYPNCDCSCPSCRPMTEDEEDYHYCNKYPNCDFLSCPHCRPLTEDEENSEDEEDSEDEENNEDEEKGEKE